jgi:MFS family permease
VARAKGQLREGLSYVRTRPDLLMTMLLVFFIATFGMNFQVTTALMSRVVFHTGASKFGLASAVFALGALIGALTAARRRRAGMRLLVGLSLAFGLLEILTGIMPTYWAFLIMLVPTGLFVISFSTAANSSVQLTSVADMRGRVMGIYMLVFLGGAPLGSLLTGLVAQDFGTRVAIIGGGAISVVSAVAIGLLISRYRGVPARRYLRELWPSRLARATA